MYMDFYYNIVSYLPGILIYTLHLILRFEYICNRVSDWLKLKSIDSQNFCFLCILEFLEISKCILELLLKTGLFSGS